MRISGMCFLNKRCTRTAPLGPQQRRDNTIYSQHMTTLYILQHRTVFITFIDDFVNFVVFSFFPCSKYTFHFPFKRASYFNSDPVSATFPVRSESQAPYVTIRILCYPSATAVLKICPRKWLLCFYKFKNLIETSANRSRKASSKC